MKAKISKKFRKHALKIFSFLCAVILWFYVLSTAKIEAEISLAVDYRLPVGMVLKNTPARTVTYKITGPRVFVRTVIQDQKKISLDFSQASLLGKTHYLVDLHSLGVSFPLGVDVLNIAPATIEVELAKEVKKTVPIELVTKESQNGTKHLLYSSLAPKTVNISGPKELISKIKKIPTMPVDLAKMQGVGIEEIQLEKIDPRLRMDFDKVKFRYDVGSSLVEYRFEKLPIRFLSTRIVTKSDRRWAQIVVLASQDYNRDELVEELKVMAFVRGEAQNNREVVPLQVELPKGVKLLSLKPQSIRVNFK